MTELMTAIDSFGLPMVMAGAFLALVYWLLKHHMPEQRRSYEKALREQQALFRESNQEQRVAFGAMLSDTQKIHKETADQYRIAMEKVADGYQIGMTRMGEGLERVGEKFEKMDEANRAMQFELVKTVSQFSAKTGEEIA